MDLLCYVSGMGNGPNRDAILAEGWRILLNPLDPRDPGGNGHGIDNGAWNAFQKWLKARIAEGMTEAEAIAAWIGGRWVEAPLDEDAFERLLEKHGSTADWVVLPDIVAGGMASLELSTRWMNRCLAQCDLVLIAVQDGMTPADLEPLVGTRVGIFLGGSTEWKLETAEMWGRWCASRPCRHPRATPENPRTGCWYHFARVNTEKRFGLAVASDADSVDGSSVTKFLCTLPKLTRAARRQDLYSPRRMAALDP